MHFTTLTRLQLEPDLYIGDTLIPYADNIKFLGLTWDSKLQWRKHISDLKADCTIMLGMLRFITGHKWGTEQYCTMNIYRMYIRVKMDYGAPVYESEATSILNSLNPIATEALRVATGAFKSTSTESLHILANKMKLNHGRDYLSLRYFFKIKSSTSNPEEPISADLSHTI